MRRAAAFVVAALATQPAVAQTPPPSEAVWRLEQDGLRLELAPLPFDVVRAFYGGRGFDKKDIKTLVDTGCLFRADIANARTTPGAIGAREWDDAGIIGQLKALRRK